MSAWLSALFVPLGVLFPQDPGDTVTLSGTGLLVEVDGFGLLRGIPASGLSTVRSPRVHVRQELKDGVAAGLEEWLGVGYELGGERFEGVAGTTGDWAERGPLALLDASGAGGAEELVVHAALGPLEVERVLRVDPDGQFLTATTVLRNAGELPLDGVYLSHEWLGSGDPSEIVLPGRASDVDALPPRALRQKLFSFGTLAPGASRAAGLVWAPTGAWPPRPIEGQLAEVPLELWTNADYPQGLVFGETCGISFGDYDGDGFIDVFACWAGKLWRNLNGETWALAEDFSSVLPPAVVRYSGIFGDYDEDGLQDIAVAPRFAGLDDCMHLLRNDGPGAFVDVAVDDQIVDVQPCGADGETNCWADVDGDGDLDLFFPAYPDWVVPGATGNKFFENLGPVGPGGEYAFRESVDAAGLGNPPLTAKPEAAQFADVDGDGDLDLFSNATLYQNRSTVGVPAFVALTPDASGVIVDSLIDEGAAFFDYDMDGDQDLVAAFINPLIGVRVLENRGDGTFFETDTSIVEEYTLGLALGMSYADWDNDGDIDLTTREVFRRNMLMETGQATFAIASHTIPYEHIDRATPAWGDWDRDGDLDAALGNYIEVGRLYDNTLYDETTLPRDRPARFECPSRCGIPPRCQDGAGNRIRGQSSRVTCRMARRASASGARHVKPVRARLPEPERVRAALRPAAGPDAAPSDPGPARGRLGRLPDAPVAGRRPHRSLRQPGARRARRLVGARPAGGRLPQRRRRPERSPAHDRRRCLAGAPDHDSRSVRSAPAGRPRASGRGAGPRPLGRDRLRHRARRDAAARHRDRARRRAGAAVDLSAGGHQRAAVGPLRPRRTAGRGARHRRGDGSRERPQHDPRRRSPPARTSLPPDREGQPAARDHRADSVRHGRRARPRRTVVRQPRALHLHRRARCAAGDRPRLPGDALPARRRFAVGQPGQRDLGRAGVRSISPVRASPCRTRRCASA